jgi:hypothetical protein
MGNHDISDPETTAPNRSRQPRPRRTLGQCGDGTRVASLAVTLCAHLAAGPSAAAQSQLYALDQGSVFTTRDGSADSLSGFFAWEPGESVWFPEAGMHLNTQDATFLDFQGTRFRFVLNQSSERSFVARVASEVTDWCPQPNPLPEHGPTSHHSADIVSQRAI